MPIDCTVVDEEGAELGRVADPSGILNTLIPHYGDMRFQCWRFIDAHGDTVFNRGQMPQFLEKLELIRAEARAGAAQPVLDSVEELAVRCRDAVHLYLKFVGD